MDIVVVREKSRQCHLLMARQRQPLLLTDVPTAPRSWGWSGEGQGEQTDAVWRGKKNYTKCFFIVRLLPKRPRCYPALLRVKKGSVNKNSRAAGSLELIQLQTHS